jgi:hypothetical protein
MRSMITLSSTAISTACSMFTPDLRIDSACGIVRGKPSKRNPLAQSGARMRSFTSAMMMSSETRSPRSITFLRLDAERRPGLHGGAQHVAGGNLRDAVALHDEPRLGPLTRSRAPEQYQAHFRPRVLLSTRDYKGSADPF